MIFKRIFKKVATRFNFVILGLISQIIAILVAIVLIVIHFPVVLTVSILVSLILVLILLRKDKPSGYKLTWIVVILTLPVLGALMYLYFGDKRPTKKIAAYMNEHALIAKHLESDKNVPDMSCVQNDRMSSLLQYIQKQSAYHPYKNTRIKYYNFGEKMFADMKKDLATAKKFIFLEYFMIQQSSMWDNILDILLQKVNEGVDVRVIIDDLGSMKLFTNRYIRKLKAKGIKIIRFNPMRPKLLLFMNNRDHRKIMVIDGHTAFSGGANIADEYINKKNRFGIWKDTGIRLEGDAVWSFTLMFIEMWDTFAKKGYRIDNYSTYRPPTSKYGERHTSSIFNSSNSQNSPKSTLNDIVLPYGDSPLDYEPLGESIYIDMMHQAERYIYIFTPYLIIGERMIYALQMAAKRGVDVRIITPGIPDKRWIFRLTRSHYRYLIKAGVKIYEYTPGFMHAKSVVSDDKIAVIGTINLDYRSLYLHFECATLLYNSNIVQEIRDDALETIKVSREVTMDCNRTSLSGEFIDALLHLVSPLL